MTQKEHVLKGASENLAAAMFNAMVEARFTDSNVPPTHYLTRRVAALKKSLYQYGKAIADMADNPRSRQT